MDPMTKVFVADIHGPLPPAAWSHRLRERERKDDPLESSWPKFTDDEGAPFVGRAEEKLVRRSSAAHTR